MSSDQSFKNRKPAMGKAEPGTIKRIFSYIFQYKWRVIAIVVCILVGAAAQAGSALFLQSLIDTYILPMVGESNSDWAPLLRAISLMAGLYVAGIVASWLWQWLIVTVEQGTLKKIRDDMFAHQQKLPIRYFDSHEHGDIMSHYTNDTDTLRQAISQSFPQMFSSIISAVAALLSMLWLSIPFTAFVIVFTVLLYFIVRKIVSRSGRYFVKQQQWIGDVNAFVEESVNGQKVIKVFNHEDATQKTFDEKNEELFEASAEANTWGNVTMPVVGNMGYLLYILLAIVGAAVSLAGVNDIGLTGVKPLTLGTLVSLLTLSRSFINPIGQVSQQLTMVMMALAGASRIFKLMDEPIEEDKGTVTLVNVELGEDGRTMTEVDHETGHWAWKREVGDDGTRSLKAAEKLRGSACEVAMKAKEQAITSPDGRYTLLRGFVRFSDIGGVLAAEIEPKNRVLPLLRGHFCQRCHDETFFLYDRTHREALFYADGHSAIVPLEEFVMAPPDETEKRYRRLWRCFYDTIAIRERENPKLRMSHMPKRFWPLLTEFQADPDAIPPSPSPCAAFAAPDAPAAIPAPATRQAPAPSAPASAP